MNELWRRTPRRWLELVTDMANEKDVGADCLRGVGFIERVEDPGVLSQHRGIRQGDATGMSPSSPGVAMRRASGKMMHEGAVNVMTEGAGGGTLPMTRGTACGRVAPAGMTQRRKAEGGRLKEYTGFSLPGRKLSEETSTRTPCKSDTMAESL